MPKRRRSDAAESTEIERDETIDVVSTDALADYIPDRLRAKLEKYCDRIIKLQVRHLPAEASTLSSWRACPGTFRVPEGEGTIDELGRKALELAIAHYRNADEKPQRYQALLTVTTPQAGTTTVQCAFELEAGLEGTIYAIDTDDRQQATEQTMWRDMVMRLESQNKILTEALASERSEHREDLKAALKPTTQLVHELAAVAAGLGSMVQGVTTGLTAAAEIHGRVSSEQYKIRRLELEHEREIAEAKQAAQLRQMAGTALQQYLPLVIGHVAGLSNEEVAALMAATQGAPAKPLMLTGEQKAWSPGEKPIVDPEAEPGDLTIDGLLSRWFYALSEDEERAARVVVGPDLYDHIRAATVKGPAQARAAVQRLNAEVRKLDPQRKSDLIKSIMGAIGNDHALYFLSIMKQAGGLEDDPTDSAEVDRTPDA